MILEINVNFRAYQIKSCFCRHNFFILMGWRNGCDFWPFKMVFRASCNRFQKLLSCSLMVSKNKGLHIYGKET